MLWMYNIEYKFSIWAVIFRVHGHAQSGLQNEVYGLFDEVTQENANYIKFGMEIFHLSPTHPKEQEVKQRWRPAWLNMEEPKKSAEEVETETGDLEGI